MFTVFKRIFIVFVILFASQAIFWWFSFAQNTWEVKCEESPTVCTVAPKEFTYYVDFTKEMLQSMNTIQWKWKKLWAYTDVWWLFTNKLLAISDDNKSIFEKMVAWIEESINKRISTVLGVTSIFSSLALTSYKDVLWLAILFQARPIVRDWKTLLDLETNINEIVYELSLSAMANVQISDPSKFQKIIDKYSKDKPLFVAWSVSEETKYKDITNMLIRLNGAMKTFIPYGRINQFDEFRKWWDGGIYLKFNTGTIEEMKLAYHCARGFSKCTSSAKDFVKNIKNIWASFAKWWTDAKKTITEANKKLAESIKWFAQTKLLKKSAGEEYLTDTEIELLKDVYGINTKKLTKQEWIWLRDLLRIPSKETLSALKFKSQWAGNDLLDKQSKANANIEAEEARQSKIDKQYINDLLEANSKKLQGIISWDSNQYLVQDPNLIQSLKNVINIVNYQQKNDDLSLLWSTNSTDYLAYYTNIGYRIREVIDIIWDKDKGIVKSLGNLCEVQCANKWVDWCFAN